MFKKNNYTQTNIFKQKLIQKVKINNYRIRHKKKKLYLKKYYFKKNIFLKILPNSQKSRKNKIKVLRLKFFFLKKLKNNINFIKFLFLKKKLKKKRLLSFFFNLTKLNNRSKTNFDHFLFFIMMRSHFFFLFSDSRFFIKKGLVFINGFSTNNPLFVAKIGDRIQIPISKVYYIYSKQIFAFFKKKIKLLKYKRWRITRYQSRFKFKKWNPLFLNKFFFYKIDCPSSLEIDYTSLTIILLKNETNYLKKNFMILKFFSILFLKSYLWKKIS